MFDLHNRIESIRASVIGLVLMVACAILGIVWISVGVYAFLVLKLGPVWGPAALGGVLFLPIVIWAIVQALWPKDKRSKAQRAYDAAFAASSVGSISRMIEAMSAHSPFLATGVAVAGGFLATRFPQFLAMFAELVTAWGDELTRHKARKAQMETEREADYERRGAPKPPPDVEPRRRGKKSPADMY